MGLLALVPRIHAAPTVEERKKRIQAMDQKTLPEALQRKARSETVLRAEGVPINRYLPVIETEGETRRRTREEVAQRALCLLVVAVKGEGLEQPIVERVASEYGLLRLFTPKERMFFESSSPSGHDRVQFAWRYEAAWALLWALGYVDALSRPAGICDVPRAVRTMQERTARTFVGDAKLRPLAEILDQADRIYRYHWAVVDARINGRPAPAGLEPGVVMERHHALNWLLGYMGQEWDDVTTDT
jgi:hypothetical protein